MRLWIDAQLSPALARWINEQFILEASAVRDLGLRDATDLAIFRVAREADAVVMTKDGDFARLLDEFGPPPRVIWLRCGNTSNARLRQLLMTTLPPALTLLEAGEPLVEISDRW